MSGIRAAAALAAFSWWLVTQPAPPAYAEAGTPPPPVELISGQEDPVAAAISQLREGDGLLLFAPGLRYYSALAVSATGLRVVHVTPGKEPIGEAQFEGWEKAVPVKPESVSFREGKIAARFGKTDVTVVSLNFITAPATRCAVLLDPDFFLPLYENEVRGGIIDLSMKLFRSMAEAGAAGFPLHVVDPLSKPSFPLQWAYAGSLWTEIWRRPDAFRDDLPVKWKMRKESEFLAGFGQFEEAARILDEAKPLFPNDGSIDFQLARLAFWDRDIPVGIRFLNRAAKIDRRYLRGYSELADYLLSRERLPAAEMVFRAGLLLDVKDPVLNAGLFRLLVDRADSRQAYEPGEALLDLEEALPLQVSDEMKVRARALVGKIRGSLPR